MAPPNKMMKKRSTTGSMSTHVLLDLDLEESSSDSDFRIEDHDNESDDFSDNSNDDDDQNDMDDDDEDDSDEDESDDEFSSFKESLKPSSNKPKETANNPLPAAKLLQQAKAQEALEKANAKLLATPICCACLGDRSDDTNEIVECDNCGISVHEGCYGISDSGSVSSTVSSCSTEPWFCEACKAGATDPVCELCPNKGGIFKETDVGKWVHLVCALYVPGVAFGEVDQLSSVTLFEMPYSKWGAKSCSLCEDVRFARTGVCIGCDAGMCKLYFHVTCAQAAGLLSEAHSEEADHADPFYAHCKIHSDKTLIKHRKRNYNGLRLKMEHRLIENEQKKSEKPTAGQQRIERKLKKHRNKYIAIRAIKTEPWVPTQKMPRLLSTSASACRKLILKAELMGIDTAACEFQEAQMAALADVRKKWHIPPAFSVEFIGYYLDRISRLKEIKSSLQIQMDLNQNLVNEQQTLRDDYDKEMKNRTEYSDKNTMLKQSIEKLHATIQALCPNKTLLTIENIERPAIAPPSAIVAPPARPMTVPTAAALKMGVGFPLTNLPGTNDDTNRILSTQCQNNSKLMHECNICKNCNDQHLLAKCDTCHLHYHLGCLNPPLTRHPKKSKLYGWQCSECVKSDDSDGAVTLPAGPRKSRTKYSKDGTIVPVDPPPIDLTTDEKKPSPGKVFETCKTIKTPSKKIEKKPQEAVVNKIEEVLVPSAPVIADSESNKTMAKGVKRKKIKMINTKIQPDTALSNNIDASPTVEINDPLQSADPLDISITESIIISDDDSKKGMENIKTSENAYMPKVKTSKKHQTDQDMSIRKPSCYIDQNGVLNNMDSQAKPGHFTSELIENKNSAEQNELIYRQNRKRRKEKHRNKYGPDSERSLSKEHKKKRKKKSHDNENPNSSASEGIPRIKIKFKALPLPGETTAEPHFFYVSADMVRPVDNYKPRPPSAVSIAEVISSVPELPKPTPPKSPAITKPSIVIKSSESATTKSKAMPFTAAPIRSRRLSVSPRKFMKDMMSVPTTVTPVVSKSGTSSNCDVCRAHGTPQDLVQCDECKQNYHFQCLDPPVKKTPKRRGYSWHCADCDPTDVESN